MAKAGSTEKVVREIRRHTRRRFSAEEKIRIVLEGLRGEESIAALCRREGLAPNLYYRWSKEFLEAGKKRLLGDTTREATSTEVQDLRRENSQLKQVVAEAVLENRVLKKIWWSPVRGTIRATDRGREARDHPACGGLGSVGAPYAAGAGGSPVHVLRVVSSLLSRHLERQVVIGDPLFFGLFSADIGLHSLQKPVEERRQVEQICVSSPDHSPQVPLLLKSLRISPGHLCRDTHSTGQSRHRACVGRTA